MIVREIAPKFTLKRGLMSQILYEFVNCSVLSLGFTVFLVFSSYLLCMADMPFIYNIYAYYAMLCCMS